MSYSACVIADSISPAGHRLSTLECTLPRIVLAELNTHRMFSRNSASSRAIKVEKQIERVLEDPFIPIYWGKNQKGMQAEVELTEDEREEARIQWLKARDSAVLHATALLKTGVHKQITNRLLEPFMWHTVIISATEFENFRGLRVSPLAQPEIDRAAKMMFVCLEGSKPQRLELGQWHLPYVSSDRERDDLIRHGFDPVRVSVARCARVSYLTQDGVRDPKQDMGLYDRLRAPGHMSPLEHAARPMTKDELDRYAMWEFSMADGTVERRRWTPGAEQWSQINQVEIVSRSLTHYLGNFSGWVQHRKTIPGEAIFRSAS